MGSVLRWMANEYAMNLWRSRRHGCRRARGPCPAAHTPGSLALRDEAVDPGEVGGHAFLDASWAPGEEILGHPVCDYLPHPEVQVLVVGDHVFTSNADNSPAPPDATGPSARGAPWRGHSRGRTARHSHFRHRCAGRPCRRTPPRQGADVGRLQFEAVVRLVGLEEVEGVPRSNGEQDEQDAKNLQSAGITEAEDSSVPPQPSAHNKDPAGDRTARKEGGLQVQPFLERADVDGTAACRRSALHLHPSGGIANAVGRASRTVTWIAVATIGCSATPGSARSASATLWTPPSSCTTCPSTTVSTTWVSEIAAGAMLVSWSMQMKSARLPTSRLPV